MPNTSREARGIITASNLIYITNTSLDGFIEDATGAFDWVDPTPVFAFITELLQPIGTHLYGRRLYETMEFWSRPIEEYRAHERDFARIWQQTEKIVYSRTIKSAAAPNTRVQRDFDVEVIRNLKRASKDDTFIGGAELAGLAFDADLVDECRLFVNPVIVGGGKPAFQNVTRLGLEPVEMRRFSNGVIYTRYRVRP